MSGLVGFVVDKMELGQVFSVFGVSVTIRIPQNAPNSSGAGTMDN
jgi:hypothetical protein